MTEPCNNRWLRFNARPLSQVNRREPNSSLNKYFIALHRDGPSEIISENVCKEGDGRTGGYIPRRWQVTSARLHGNGLWQVKIYRVVAVLYSCKFRPSWRVVDFYGGFQAQDPQSLTLCKIFDCGSFSLYDSAQNKDNKTKRQLQVRGAA